MRIAELRKSAEMSQLELARMLNVSRSTVAMWEKGTNPSIDLLTKMAEVFEVSVDFLIGNSEKVSDMNRLRELRKEAGLTMKEFGEQFGLSESTISLYETQNRYPSLSMMKRFAEFYNVSLDYISCYSDDNKALDEERISDKRIKAIELIAQLEDEEISRVEDFIAGIKASRK